MSEFWIYFEKGLRHILRSLAYDHILFLIALSDSLCLQRLEKIIAFGNHFYHWTFIGIAIVGFWSGNY